MTLKLDVANWDGKKTEKILDAYERFSDNDDFIDCLIAYLADIKLEIGASWLIKHSFENSQEITHKQEFKIVSGANDLSHWAAKLHILQCLPYIEIGEMQVVDLNLFIQNSILDDNKFVRSWAYNAFYNLAVQHETYMAACILSIETAIGKESPAVCARLRNILKQHEKNTTIKADDL